MAIKISQPVGCREVHQVAIELLNLVKGRCRSIASSWLNVVAIDDRSRAASRLMMLSRPTGHFAGGGREQCARQEEYERSAGEECDEARQNCVCGDVL